jgi:hypothetical protein
MPSHVTLRERSFWQTDGKRCPSTLFTLDLDPAAMGLDNLPGDREPEPGPGGGTGRLHGVESLKDVRQGVA